MKGEERGERGAGQGSSGGERGEREAATGGKIIEAPVVVRLPSFPVGSQVCVCVCVCFWAGSKQHGQAELAVCDVNCARKVLQWVCQPEASMWLAVALATLYWCR